MLQRLLLDFKGQVPYLGLQGPGWSGPSPFLQSTLFCCPPWAPCSCHTGLLSLLSQGRQEIPSPCVFVHATSYSCHSPTSTLLSLLVSCISIRYRLKCHFFQKALPEPAVLPGSPIHGALHQLNILPSHFSELCPLPSETWNNLGKNTSDMDEGGLGDFTVVIKYGQKSWNKRSRHFLPDKNMHCGQGLNKIQKSYSSWQSLPSPHCKDQRIFLEGLSHQM